jgi:hypothetical protein
MTDVAWAARIDRRDLESGLVGLTLAHAAKMADCPGRQDVARWVRDGYVHTGQLHPQ